MILGGGNSKPKPFISSAFKEDSNPYFDSDFFKLIFFSGLCAWSYLFFPKCIPPILLC